MKNNCENDIFCGLNRTKKMDPNEMSDLEKKHVPHIEVESITEKENKFKISVELGKYMDHPNEHNHFIQWIELYSGETFLGRIDFASGRTEPKTIFEVNLDHLHDLKALAHCNMHGTWENKKKLE
ncbi:MAG: desulfoferrodoxin family protein [Candidatus Aenigmatarchaeota archaeon]